MAVADAFNQGYNKFDNRVMSWHGFDSIKNTLCTC